MTDLERRALARLPLTAAAVEKIDAEAADATGWWARTIRLLCESCERLRMELQGAESVIEELQRGVGEARRVLGEANGETEE